MFRRQLDILAVGDMTTDAFIRLKDAHVHCKMNHKDCELCMAFGAKIPFEYVKVTRAVGNAANAAVAASRLGLNVSLVSNIGDDENGRECLVELKKQGVDTSLVRVHKGMPTNYHFVLWFDTERTILVNHIPYKYEIPKPLNVHYSRNIQPKWVYFTSVATDNFPYHEYIAEYIKKNPKVRLAFQPGTFQISLGLDRLRSVLELTDVFIVNMEEAEKLVGMKNNDIKALLKKLHDRGPKIVLITNGEDGSYMFDGDHFYAMPIYHDPKPAIERTGCGDAFASTFVSALAMGKTPLEALHMAPANPMSVAQYVGAQEGLLTLQQLEWWLKQAPREYRPREI